MSEYIIHIEDAKTIYGNADFLFPLDAYLREKIVRCGDCVYFDKYENDEISVCYRFDNEQPIVEPYGYCAWGKRE